jgi:hypothetical protein
MPRSFHDVWAAVCATFTPPPPREALAGFPLLYLFVVLLIWRKTGRINAPFSVQNTPFSGENLLFSQNNAPFSAENTVFSPQNKPFPGENSSFSFRNKPFPPKKQGVFRKQ